MELVAERRRRAVRQRLEGDERRVGAAVDRELRRGSGADHRRPVQGRRPAAAARAAGGAREGGRRDRRGQRRWCARRWPDVVDGARGRVARGGGRDARSRWRSRRAWCCSRRRARASTCSATTRSADARFKEEVARIVRTARPAVAGRPATVSGEQSSVGLCGGGLAAGNAGCPGLRSWCLRPRPTDDC